MKPIATLALLSLAATLLAGGCSDESASNDGKPPLVATGKPKRSLRPTTYKLKPEVVQVGQVVANQALVLHDRVEVPQGARGAEMLANARPGQILLGPPNQRPAGQKVAGPSEPNPHGFARKVVSVSKDKGAVVVVTSHASLTDIFEKLFVAVGDPALIEKYAPGAVDSEPAPAISRAPSLGAQGAEGPGLVPQDNAQKSCAQVAEEQGWPFGAYTCDDGSHGWCNGNFPTATADCAACCSPSCGDIGARLGKTASDPPLQCDNGNGACSGLGVATWDCSLGCCGPGVNASSSPAQVNIAIDSGASPAQSLLSNMIGATGSLSVEPSFSFSPNLTFVIDLSFATVNNLLFILDGTATAGLRLNGEFSADPKALKEFIEKQQNGEPPTLLQESKPKATLLTLPLPLGLPLPTTLEVGWRYDHSWSVGLDGSLDLEGSKTWTMKKGLSFNPGASPNWQQIDEFGETPWSWTKQSAEVVGTVKADVWLEWDLSLLFADAVGPFLRLKAPEIDTSISYTVGHAGEGDVGACYAQGAIDISCNFGASIGCRTDLADTFGFLGVQDTEVTFPVGSVSVNLIHQPLQVPLPGCLSCFPAISEHACINSTDCCTGNCVGPASDRKCACSSEGGACQIDSDCCPQGGKNVACDGGHCSSSCGTQCTPGDTQCDTPSQYRQCEATAGCAAWKVHPCKTSTACYSSKDECVNGATACQDQCAAGATECNTPTEYRKCEAGPQGCTVWNPHPCKTSTACYSSKDECVNGAATCACASGKKQDGTPIDPASTYCGMKVCGVDNNEYSCGSDNQWSPTGATCPPLCQDQCTAGTAQCNTPTEYRKCEAGPQGCTVWNPHPCKTSTACFVSLDVCQSGCATDCTLGQIQCNQPSEYRKCETDTTTGCDTWKNYACKAPGTCFSDLNSCTGNCKASYVSCSATSQCCSGLTCKKDVDNTLACLP